MSLSARRVNIARCIGAIDASKDISVTAPVVRRLEHEDAEELKRVLLGLEPADRCTRFGAASSDDFLASHTTSAIADANWTVGAFVGGRLRGVVEVYDSGQPGHAEATFVVEREWRRRGLGWALLQSAMRLVADSETRTLRMMFPRHNWPMRKLAGKAGGRLDMVLGEITVDVAVGTFRAGRAARVASE